MNRPLRVPCNPTKDGYPMKMARAALPDLSYAVVVCGRVNRFIALAACPSG